MASPPPSPIMVLLWCKCSTLCMMAKHISTEGTNHASRLRFQVLYIYMYVCTCVLLPSIMLQECWLQCDVHARLLRLHSLEQCDHMVGRAYQRYIILNFHSPIFMPGFPIDRHILHIQWHFMEATFVAMKPYKSKDEDNCLPLALCTSLQFLTCRQQLGKAPCSYVH